MSSNDEENSIRTGEWLERSYSNRDNGMSVIPCWLSGAADVHSQVSPPLAPLPADASMNGGEEVDGITTGVRNNKNVEDTRRQGPRNAYKHVPHKDRPPLIVARRNARERRRVQAVNTAFMKLRKIVPIVNNRGKRISKVKTLQTAIDYISGLQALLKQTDMYYDIDIISDYRYQSQAFCHSLEDFDNEY